MPITKSAKKALRVSRRKRVANLVTIKKYKDAVKAVRKSGKDDPKLLSNAYKQLDKAAKKNLIHRNKAARLKSRLASAAPRSKSK